MKTLFLIFLTLYSSGFASDLRDQLKEEFHDLLNQKRKADRIASGESHLKIAKVRSRLLLLIHPQMKQYDFKTKRLIEGTRNLFQGNGFYKSFRTHLVGTVADLRSEQQLTSLAKLNRIQSLDENKTQKGLQAIQSQIDEAVNQVRTELKLDLILHENAITEHDQLNRLQKINVVSPNIRDITEKCAIRLYQNLGLNPATAKALLSFIN